MAVLVEPTFPYLPDLTVLLLLQVHLEVMFDFFT